MGKAYSVINDLFPLTQKADAGYASAFCVLL